MKATPSAIVAAILAFNGVTAHPGHSVAQEAAERREFLTKRQPISVRSCANDFQKRGHAAAAVARRSQLAQKAKARRSIPLDAPLKRRNFKSAYNISHASSGVNFGDNEDVLFADNSSCILQGEVTQGPYYVDGELIRDDIRDGQEGVPLFLDVQLIDTSTCDPVPAVYVDFWHCNATGVYSGVQAGGNGNKNDASNLDNTFLRGLQQTNANGVVQIESIFPGHYTGRATHIHIDRKSTRLNSSHSGESRMPSSA